jgi:aspartokinase
MYVSFLPLSCVTLLTIISQITVSKDMAILSLVGRQMRHMVGIAGKMFSTLADGNVNIEMISQGQVQPFLCLHRDWLRSKLFL